MSRVTFYTRCGCCLCDGAREVLLAARKRAAFDLEEIDIDRDLALRARYNDEVPVIAINGRDAFHHRLSLEEFLKQI